MYRLMYSHAPIAVALDGQIPPDGGNLKGGAFEVKGTGSFEVNNGRQHKN